MIKDLKEKKTNIHENAFVADTASVIGDVTLGEGSSIWYGAVARGDMNYIKIGRYSNIQDNSTVHQDTKFPCEIGDYVTVGHNTVIHGCKVGDNCLIGMGSVILNGAQIGENCIVAAGSVVTEGAIIPANSMIMGIPAKVKRQLTEKEIEKIKNNAIRYEALWKEYHR